MFIMNDLKPSDADILSRANLSNIGKKLKAGKTLTTSERKALNDFQSGQLDGWVKDTTTLAKELGLSRQAIYDARNRFPDAPKKHEDGRRENLAAWQQFCADNVIGKDVATKNLAELKAELMREQIRLARAKNEREAGDVIDRDVVEAMLVTLGQKLDLLLRLKLEVELGPRVAGKSAAEANVEGGEILAEIREVINSNVAKFEGEALAKSRAAEVET
jgi:phage terminase Nu1 subunit (DNA packaging protein)